MYIYREKMVIYLVLPCQFHFPPHLRQQRHPRLHQGVCYQFTSVAPIASQGRLYGQMACTITHPYHYCCCLPCNHCSYLTWVVEEILAFGNRPRSTHCREFNYLNYAKHAYFVRTTQLLPHPGHE